ALGGGRSCDGVAPYGGGLEGGSVRRFRRSGGRTLGRQRRRLGPSVDLMLGRGAPRLPWGVAGGGGGVDDRRRPTDSTTPGSLGNDDHHYRRTGDQYRDRHA